MSLTVPDPAKPDDIYQAVLESIFGPDSLILYIFIFLSWVLAWYAWVKSTHSRARNIYSKVFEIPAAMRVKAALWALSTPVVQAVYLALSYFIATHLGKSMSETNGPADVDVSTWFAPPETSPSQDPVFWIWFVVAVILVMSGWWSAIGEDGDITPFHPIAWFLFGCGGFAVLFLFFLNHLMAWLAIIYLVAAVLALYMPRSCVNAWRERPTRAP